MYKYLNLVNGVNFIMGVYSAMIFLAVHTIS